MKKNGLEIVYCKNCKFYSCRIINKDSSLHICRKDLDVSIDKPELLCNKPCYIKKVNKNK